MTVKMINYIWRRYHRPEFINPLCPKSVIDCSAIRKYFKIYQFWTLGHNGLMTALFMHASILGIVTFINKALISKRVKKGKLVNVETRSSLTSRHNFLV